MKEESSAKREFFKNKKVMIPVLSLLLIVIILVTTFSVLYVPRKLSSYVDCKINNIESMYVMYSNDRFDIEHDEYQYIMQELKEIKVQPVLHACKCLTPYTLYIKSNKRLYKINGFYIDGRGYQPCKIKNMDQFEELLNQYIKKTEE